MIGLVDVTRSLDAFAAQTAAAPAKSTHALPVDTAPAPAEESTPAANRISISPEALRQLERERQLDAEQAVTRKAASEDVELAARMAHEIAYRREVIVVPATRYANLPSSVYFGGGSVGSNSVGIARAQSELDQARLARIALYELEQSRGTPPAEIYARLSALNAARPTGYGVAVAT